MERLGVFRFAGFNEAGAEKAPETKYEVEAFGGAGSFNEAGAEKAPETEIRPRKAGWCTSLQ